jgi:hypothetical protein
MTVISDPTSGSIRLEGDCPLEDSEILVQMLTLADPAVVDWRDCTGIHTAVLQILIAGNIKLVGPPASAFLRQHIDPVLGSSGGRG